MKVCLFLTIFFFWGKSFGNEIYSRRGEFIPPPGLFDTEELNQAQTSETLKHHKELKKIKYSQKADQM